MIRGEWPLVGREDELARATAALSATGGLRGPNPVAGVLLAGPPGTGKSHIARACARQAAAVGYLIDWIHGDGALVDAPLAAFTAFLPEARGQPSPERLLRDAYAVFRARAERGHLVLVIEDAHLLDDLSATAVHQLVTSGVAAAVLTVRTRDRAPSPLAELWKSGWLERVDVDCLTRDQVHDLLCRVMEGPVDMSLSFQLWQASEGNPLYLRELFHAAWDDGAVAWSDGVWRLTGALSSSPQLVELVEARLADLDQPSRDALELLAVGEPIDLTHLSSLVDLDVLSDLELRGLLRLTDDRGRELVRLAHPIYGEVLREAVRPAHDRALKRSLAEVYAAAGDLLPSDARRLARWRVEGGLVVDVSELIDAAESAKQAFELPFAERCARTAYRQCGGATCGQLLGDILALANRYEEAEAIFAEVEGLATDDDEIVVAGQARSFNLYMGLGRYGDATGVNARAQAAVRTEAARERLACHQASFDWFEGMPLLGWAVVEPMLATDRGPLSFETAMVGSRLCMLLGRFSTGLEIIRRVPAQDTQAGEVRAVFYPNLAALAEVLLLVHAGRLDEAEEIAVPRHEAAIRHGELVARGLFAIVLGYLSLLRGRPVTATGWFREAVSVFTNVGATARARLAQAGLVRALSLAGDREAAADALARLDEGFPRAWRGFETEVVAARAALLALSGDLDGAAEILTGAAPALQADGNAMFEAAVLHDLLRLGRAGEAHRERLMELGDVVDGEFMACRSAHAAAVEEHSWTRLADVADRFEAIGMPLFAAEACCAASALAGPAGLDREATALRRRSNELAAQCEGAQTPGLAQGESSIPLTPRERQIATMAARGLSTAAIADELVVSSRTVENQLQRAYRKLGVSRRADLAAALGEDPGENE